MRPISAKNKQAIDNLPYYKVCIRSGEDCQGRITIEHVFIYAGRQIDELWNLLPVCAYHHEVDNFQDNGDLNKEIHQWHAINRMTLADQAKYPKKNWDLTLYYLNGKYGKPKV